MDGGPQYDFEWDYGKARSNLEKHSVSFEEAAKVFLDPHAVSLSDQEHSEGEERWITLGLASFGRLLVVIHTFEDLAEGRSRVGLISARLATRRERRQYEEQP